MPTCLLVRHAHSRANAEGILAGRMSGVHLTELGQDQAARLAERFAGVGVAAVYTSPLERCLETAEAIAQTAGVRLSVEPDLEECAYGAWTGRPLAELTQDPLWATVQDNPIMARFPDHDRFEAECLREMDARVTSAVRRLDEDVRRTHGESAVWVAVTHGDLIKAVLADATGTGLRHLQSFVADPASVSAVRYGGRHTFLLAANVVDADLHRFTPADELVAGADAVVGGGAGTAGVGGHLGDHPTPRG